MVAAAVAAAISVLVAAAKFEKLQGKTRPKVDESMIDVRIEQLWEYIKEDGTVVVVKQWCSGVVVAVKTQTRVLIKWDMEHI